MSIREHELPGPPALELRGADRRNAFVGGTAIPAEDDLLNRGVFGLNAGDPRARPFVLLRTQLLNIMDGMKVRFLAVTSPKAANGKSYVAANLATAISRVEDVCLLDLHLRRPVIAEWFATPASGGVSACLTGRGTLRDAHFRIEHERLNIFPAGDPRDDTSTLLSSSLLSIFMSQMRSLPGDPICIIDCPPVLENDDMMLIAKHVDGVLLIAEEGRTTRRDITDSIRMLGSTRIIATLLNKSIVPAVLPDR